MSEVSPKALRLLALLDELERAGLIGSGSYFTVGATEIPSSRNLVTLAGLKQLRNRAAAIRSQEGEG